MGEINMPEKICEMVAKKAYKAAENKCPSQALTADTHPPWAQKLEDLMCAQMRKGNNEQHCVEIVCGEIRKEIHMPEKMCEIVAKKAYKAAENKCPSPSFFAGILV